MPKSLVGAMLLALALAVAGAAPAVAATEAEVNATIDKVLGKSALYENTVKGFQQAVIAGNKQDAAAFVRYPIPITFGGRKHIIRSAAEFVKNYDAIMSPDIVAAVKNQKYEDLFVSGKGIMFGNGEVWVTGMCLDRKCRTMIPVVVGIQHTGN